MITVDRSSLEESVYFLTPQFITDPCKVRVQISEDWIDEEIVDPLKPIGVVLYTENGRFTTNYRTFKSLLGSLYIQEQLSHIVSPSLLESLANSILQQIPESKGPSFVIDNEDIACDVVRNAGMLPVYLNEAIHHMAKTLSFSLTGSENTEGVVYLPLIHEDNSTKVSIVHESQKITIFGDVWYGGVSLASSNSGRLTPTISSFMVREYDNFVLTLPGINLRYSAPKNGDDRLGGIGWIEDAVGMAASTLESSMSNIKHLAAMDVEEDLSKIIRDILRTIQLPRELRAKIVSDVVNEVGQYTAYGLMVTVGEAQLTEDLSFAILDKTQQAAGKVLGVLGHRCDHCHQLVE